MKISYKELQVNDYTIRGLFTEPDNGYTDIAVMLHGYTGHKNENGFLFKQIAKTLVECGIATLRFDYYGSGDSDGEFHEQNFTTVRNDAKAAIDEAVRLNNGKKVLVCGFSMGGAVAARMSIEKAELIFNILGTATKDYDGDSYEFTNVTLSDGTGMSNNGLKIAYWATKNTKGEYDRFYLPGQTITLWENYILYAIWEG